MIKIFMSILAVIFSFHCSASSEIREFKNMSIMDDEKSQGFKKAPPSISHVIKGIQTKYPDLAKIRLLDLSYNYIDDNAILKLKPFLAELTHLEILDLTANMGVTIKGIKEFQELLLRENFKYLVIPHTGASTLQDIGAFAQSLSENKSLSPQKLATCVQKLIFLDKNWLNSFEGLLPLEYIQAHRKYYDLNKSIVTPVPQSKLINSDLTYLDMIKQSPALTELIRQALENNPEACYRLGIHYYSGEDMRQDLAKAFYWHKKAAEAHHLPALYQLYYFYKNGLGVRKNLNVADRLWLQMMQHPDWPQYKDCYTNNN